MLEEININNFAIIDMQTVPFSRGLNVMSGETGAGKSILIDALGLQLGDRADSNWIRHGETRCNIQSIYRFPIESDLQSWLNENEFECDEDGTCQLRRTLSTNGKSNCYINGISTTARHTRQLGEMLVDIHGQHAHQSLMSADKQLELLDNFANHRELVVNVRQSYKVWQNHLKKQKKLLNNDNNLSDKRELLRYQLDELHNLDLCTGEFSELSEKQKYLNAANDIIIQIDAIEQIIDGEHGISHAFNQIITSATLISTLDKKAESFGDLFSQALIYIDEGRSALSHYAQTVELNPQQLSSVESRMSALHDIARKHKVAPDELPLLLNQLQSEIDDLDNTLTELNKIDAVIKQAEEDYLTKAQVLSDSRNKSAKKLCVAVDAKLSLLNLEHSRFSIDCTNTASKATGINHIVFLFAPNPGQGEKPLHKIASGGELSRISLAIQVAGIARQADVTFIFDEIDSGIGGATAEVVGRLLKTLSQYNQVICVTHLAQVAAFADHHIEISKSVQDGETFTQFHTLDEKSRIAELARMSGGLNPDKKTQEHAKELRNNALQFTASL